MYKALYRQYRPRTFHDLVGQTVIAQTLENALKSQKVGHAYLFAGPRGTGKTSVAKIFAREIEGISADSKQETFTDIIEIDAASNNGVDEIRNLRDAANYAPIECPFKIYIIDEVHMLSTGAFNALLKTIEEPPAQVKFILATTEAQKIPATILSRVQRFDFRRISIDDIVARLEYVLNDQNIAYDPQALKVIANASDGGLRDALSVLDQAVAISKSGKINLDDVFQITGTSRIDQQISFLSHLLTRQTTDSFEDIHTLLLAGKDPIRFAEDLLILLKNLMLMKIAPDLVTENGIDQIKDLSGKYTNTVFEQLIDELSDILAKMKQTTRPELYLEIFAVKVVAKISQTEKQTVSQSQLQVEQEKPIAVQTLQQPKETLPTAQAKAAPSAEETISDPTPPVKEKQAAQAVEQNDANAETDTDAAWLVMKTAVKSELQAAKEAWPDIVGDFDEAVLMLAENAEPVAASQTALIIAFNHPELADAAAQTPDFVDKLSESLQDLLGVDYQLVFISEASWVTLKQTYIARLRGEKVEEQQTKQPSLVVKATAKTAEEVGKTKPIPADTVEANEDVIDKAKKLFGDIVKIEGEDN
ncbi:DNA polymerase III subunit gamma/tau [Oenococcus sicerae]|uniref:DNA-directed DNA polymerase n=1 Tax=Oenococcus sicerae TaxID=2203724 RepID=A0AAJ1VMN4_9LACO|nr:DNA polymerase III subunit gamma/tau [Oenococcus sicerae]MDN6900758.1 DNA polymerase III subunit gamma/tau [Oenococcus sicerae]